jgi:hypothetical protein
LFRGNAQPDNDYMPANMEIYAPKLSNPLPSRKRIKLFWSCLLLSILLFQLIVYIFLDELHLWTDREVYSQ